MATKKSTPEQKLAERVRRAAPDLLAAVESLLTVACFPLAPEERTERIKAAQAALDKARYDNTGEQA